MPRVSNVKTVCAVFLVAAHLGACTPIMATRGNFLEDDKLKTIQLGVSTKDEVAQKLGSPTSVDPFDNNIWMYIGERTSAKAFFTPHVDARKVVKLTFNQDGLLQDAKDIDEKSGKEVEIVTKKTPTPGREINAVEQFLGNLGKFNQSQMPGAAGPIQGR